MERIAAIRIPKAKTGTDANTERQLPLRSGRPIAVKNATTKMPMMMTRHSVSVVLLVVTGVVSLMPAVWCRLLSLRCCPARMR